MAASASTCLFIQFAREPVPGAVKTRMRPHLSAQQACSLHSDLVLWTAETLVSAGLGTIELAVAGRSDHPLFVRCLGLGLSAVQVQQGADLGERMYNALESALQRAERVILVGSDCPAIDRAYLEQALAALDRAPVVLGPAVDGGYVLIGVRRVRREMFAGINWGSATVLAATTRRLRQSGITWVELAALADIDRPEDLVIWESLKAAHSTPEGEFRP